MLGTEESLGSPAGRPLGEGQLHSPRPEVGRLERSCFHFGREAWFVFAVWGRAHHLVSWGSIGLHCRGQRAGRLAKAPALAPLLPEGPLVRLPVHSLTQTGTPPVLLRRLHFRNLGPLDMCLKPSRHGRAARSLPGFPGSSQALPRAPAPGPPPAPSSPLRCTQPAVPSAKAAACLYSSFLALPRAPRPSAHRPGRSCTLHAHRHSHRPH